MGYTVHENFLPGEGLHGEQTGDRLYKRMLSYRYRGSHYNNKMGIPIPWKTQFILNDKGPGLRGS